MLNIPTP